MLLPFDMMTILYLGHEAQDQRSILGVGQAKSWKGCVKHHFNGMFKFHTNYSPIVIKFCVMLISISEPQHLKA